MKTCKNKCKSAKVFTESKTEQGHDVLCSNRKALTMFAKEEGWDLEDNKMYIFDIMELQNRECPYYKIKKG